MSTILGGDFSGRFLVEADVQVITVADQHVPLPFGVRQSLRAEFADPDQLATYAKRPYTDEIDLGLNVLDGTIFYARDDTIDAPDITDQMLISGGVPDGPGAPDGVSSGLVMGDSAITPI